MRCLRCLLRGAPKTPYDIGMLDVINGFDLELLEERRA
jgi:hypothetical protein